MDKLTENELKALYANYVKYRDTCCNGRADMTIQGYFIKHGLKYHKDNGEIVYHGTYRLIGGLAHV